MRYRNPKTHFFHHDLSVSVTLWNLRTGGSIEGKIKDEVTGGHSSLCRC